MVKCFDAFNCPYLQNISNMAELLSHLTKVTSRCQSRQDTSDAEYDGRILGLLAYLKQPEKGPELANASGFILKNLDPSEHSLSYLYVLHFRIQSLNVRHRQNLPSEALPGGYTWRNIVRFLGSFDPIQIRYAGHEWRQLVEFVGEVAQASSKPILAIQVIKRAMRRMHADCGVFTSVHLMFIRLCLLAKSYKNALPVLENQLYHFPTEPGQVYQKWPNSFLCSEHEHVTAFITHNSGLTTKLSHKDHLLYFLYGAMVYMALKEWRKALHFLGLVISAPVINSVSKVMIEAYKKSVLVSLLGYGKLQATPGIIPSHIMRVYQSLAKPYISLADAFELGHYDRLNSEAGVARSVWLGDNNAGLVQQVLCAFNRSVVLKMERTFSALRMTDVARRMSPFPMAPEAVEAFIASLIMSNNLAGILVHSRVNDDSTMLRFSAAAGSHVFHEGCVQRRLVQANQSFTTLSESIEQSNLGLEFTTENFQFLQKNQKWPDNTGKMGISSVSGTAGSFDIDEDIMGDLH